VTTTSGPIVFASDRSPTLYVSHRWQTFVATRQTLEVAKPDGTPAPDGRAKALVTRDRQGTVTVDVRSTPSGETHRVATYFPAEGTVPSVSQIVWSPNSRWLAIVVDAACGGGVAPGGCNIYDLWAVRADGTHLHEVSLHARGPSWSPDSRELAFFGMFHNEPFVSYARANGGAATPLAPGEIPAWSTRGRGIAYAGPHGVQLVVPARRGVHILLRRRLLEPASWSPSGKQLALVTTRFDRRDASLDVVTVGGRRVATLTKTAEHRQPALARWSPNGKQIAYTAATTPGTPLRNVLVQRAVGGLPVRLTNLDPWFSFASLAWTRDGRAVVYDASQYANDLELFTMRPDGSGVEQLTNNTFDDTAPSWSPDGTTVVDEGSRAIDGTASGLFTYDLGSATERRVTTGNDHHPAWSPDGGAIAFSRWENDFGAPERIFLTDPSGTRVTPLTPPEQTTADLPSWSPDGKRIVYVDQAPGSNRALFVIDRSGTTPVQLTTLPFATDPAWSPDGTKIAFYGTEDLAGSYIYVINADGTGLRRVVKPQTTDLVRPAWSPDGTRLLYEAAQDYAHSEIRSVKLDSTDDHALTLALGRAEFPAWSAVVSAARRENRVR
jgi:TolB protein